MGIDWGIALGSAAKTGLDTFTKLKEQERLEALEARQTEQFDAWRKEQALRAEEQAASKETYGKVGTQQLNPQDVNKIADSYESGFSPQYNPEGVTKPLTSALYTKEQAAEDYKTRMYGINPEKAMQSELTQTQLEAAGLSIKQSKRVEKQQVELDKFYDEQKNNKLEFDKDPVEWVKKNIGAYNNATKGPLNDGLNAEVVKGVDGNFSLVRTDSKTKKIVDSTPINDQTANLAFKEIQKSKFFELPGNMQAAIANDLEKRKVDATVTTAAAATKNAETQAGFYGKGGVYERVSMAKVEQKTNEFGSKLPQAVKYSLDQQKTGLGKIEAQLALDPANKELQLNFGKNLLRYNQTLKDNGLDINVYDGTGIPSPQDAASQILNNKNLKPKDIESRIAAANYISPSYGTEVSKLISESKALAPAASTTITKPNAAININTEKTGGPKPIGPQMEKAANLRAEVTKVENRAQAIKVKENIDTLTTQIKNAQEDPSMKPRQINALKLQLQSQQEQYNRLTKN
jgi:hypothetical protein